MHELAGTIGWEASSSRANGPITTPDRRWRSWDARLWTPGPTHLRRDRPDGKRVSWVDESGWPGLGDHRLEDLVYVAGGLTPPVRSRVVCCEGEKAADAIWAAGIPAVGTVCGASSTPGPSVASLFAGVAVVLWPDNDTIGRDHLGRFGRALELAGVAELRVVDWPAAPKHGDAADVGDARNIRTLVRAARWVGPVR